MINESYLGNKETFEFKCSIFEKIDIHYLNKSDMDHKTLNMSCFFKLLKIGKK